MGDLTRDEFLVHVGYLREDIAEVKAHLGTLNGRTRMAENQIAVLHSRAAESEVEAKKHGGSSGAKWGAGLGGAIAGLVALWQALNGGGQ
jgi:hypothetical protein